MAPTEPFLSPTDVAELLNISARQVRGLLASGELRGMQIGGRGIWRIAPADLQDFIDRQYRRTAEEIHDGVDVDELADHPRNA